MYIHTNSHAKFKCSLIIPGSVFCYSLLQISLLWLFHVFTLFWTIRFPLHFTAFRKTTRFKYLHISMLCAALFVPAIPIVVMLNTRGFVNSRFPPLFCLARNDDATFYTFILPATIILALGISLLMWTYWILYMVSTLVYHTHVCPFHSIGG